MKWWGLEAWRNRNVRLALIYDMGMGCSYGLFGSTVLSGYLIDIPPKKNFLVGLAEGMQGAMQVLIALPAGTAADNWSRESVLKIASLTGMFAVALFIAGLIYGLFSDSIVLYVLMCLALSALGVYDGLRSGAMEALFHDSIASTERPAVTTTKFVFGLAARTIGPVISSVLFYIFGNKWTRPELTIVFMTGVCILMFPIILLTQFRDADTLGHESEAIAQSPASLDVDAQIAYDTMQEVEELEMMLEDEQQQHDNEHSSSNGRVAPSDDPEGGGLVDGDVSDNRNGNSLGEQLLPGGDERRKKSSNSKYYIPRIVLASDITFGIASGTTIKFFPLFFKNEVDLSPASVNWVFVASPVLIMLTSIITTRLSKIIGRVWVPLLCSGSGIILLVWMWQMGETDDKKLWKTPHVIVPIFLVRTALMNANQPIRKSILMDFVDKKERAWYNSIDSVTKFSWSGSALIGGYICDKKGYGYTFLLTAGLQLVALIIFSFLLYYRKIIK